MIFMDTSKGIYFLDVKNARFSSTVQWTEQHSTL